MNRGVWVLLADQVLMNTGFFMLFPLLTVHLTRDLGFDATGVGNSTGGALLDLSRGISADWLPWVGMAFVALLTAAGFTLLQRDTRFTSRIQPKGGMGRAPGEVAEKPPGGRTRDRDSLPLPVAGRGAAEARD